LDVGYTGRYIMTAIYDASGNLLGSTSAFNGLSGTQWVTMQFGASKPSLTAGATYLFVVWASKSTQDVIYDVYLHYTGTLSGAGFDLGRTYGTWPNPASFNNDDYQYCIFCSYTTP
jgi:hypothetical protein